MFLLCAKGACCPGHSLRALAESAQRRGDPGLVPSYCERSLGKAQGWGPALFQGRDLDQGKDLGEGYLPLEDQVLTLPWISCSWVSSRDLTRKESLGEEEITSAKVWKRTRQKALI